MCCCVLSLIFVFVAYKINLGRKDFIMTKKIFVLFLLVIGFVCGARAELKVDILAGATEPISIAVQKFEVADGVRKAGKEGRVAGPARCGYEPWRFFRLRRAQAD